MKARREIFTKNFHPVRLIDGVMQTAVKNTEKMMVVERKPVQNSLFKKGSPELVTQRRMQDAISKTFCATRLCVLHAFAPAVLLRLTMKPMILGSPFAHIRLCSCGTAYIKCMTKYLS